MNFYRLHIETSKSEKRRFFQSVCISQKTNFKIIITNLPQRIEFLLESRFTESPIHNNKKKSVFRF